MNHFQRRDNVLYCEGVSLLSIAKQYGSPVYVYSTATITRHVKVLQQSLQGIPHHICYAVKCNSNLAILDLLKSLKCGFDAVSVGELAKVQHIGAPMNNTIFSGVGKRDDEIETALRAKVLYICIESAAELEAVARVAQTLNLQAPVAIRVNPDVDAQTHPYISTGLRNNKFGVPFEQVESLFKTGIKNSNLKMVGVTCHIGSQITNLAPFVDAANRMSHLVKRLKKLGAPLEFVGMGGGLGIPYHLNAPNEEAPPTPKSYGEAMKSILGPLNLTAVFEPGRVIIGNAGVLLTQVVRVKQGSNQKFALVDAGMNDLIRPALYQAYHEIELVEPKSDLQEVIDIVGPVCESSDTFASQRPLPRLSPGDLLAIRSVGAYGMAMASSYNGRPLPAEVLCNEQHMQLIRKRDEISDLWRGEFRLQA